MLTNGSIDRCNLCPPLRRLAGYGRVTVSVTDALWPPKLAVTCAVPAIAPAVTTPALVTVTTTVSLDDQSGVTVADVSSL